jgi:NADH-quinone oxidoreductase subunit C
MDVSVMYQRLLKQFGPAIVASRVEAVDPWIETSASAIAGVCRFLRDEPDLRFNMLHCITAVDYFTADAKKAAAADWKPRLELVYHLSSTIHRHRLVLKVFMSRWKDDVEGRLPEVPSLCGVWSAAEWHEREVFDLSGVFFTGHPDLRRILLPEDWVGHPLRKDYQMVAQYHGIPRR